MLEERVPGVATLDAASLAAATADAYRRLARGLDRGDARHAVRFWNFIPGILEPLGDGLDRYRAFNRGRHAAFLDRFPAPTATSWAIPTASGVGVAGDALEIFALACGSPGRAVENPRQRPAYRYSSRYGPVSPAFARATAVETRDGLLLLVGGTASVRGEDSVHPGDLDAQLEETFENLEEVLRSAVRACGVGALRYADLRVHVPRAEDAAEAGRATAARYPGLDALEVVLADLCRGDLLVEIEGLARLDKA